MSNPISDRIKTGTIGELLVQLRLLQYGVQAAPPLKDSGNDLVAVKGEVFRTIQVKTRTNGEFPRNDLPDLYHLYALVHLNGEDSELYLDQTAIYLIPKETVKAWTRDCNLEDYTINQEHIDVLFEMQ